MFQKCDFTHRIVRPLIMMIIASSLSACTEKSRNPLSPNIAGPIEGVTISVPALTEPGGGRLVRTDEQPVALSFAAATSNGERPFWYEIEIGSDHEFANIVHRSNRITPLSSTQNGRASQDEPPSGVETYMVPDTLAPDRVYYWHVRAADGANTGPFSDTSQFEIFTPITIQAPRPTSPMGDEVVGSRRPSFKVKSAEITGPATNIKYRFEVARDGSFANLVAVMTVDPGGANTSATPSELDWNTRYKWRVRASGSGREGRVDGPWSATQSFKTPAVPVVAPTPVSPINRGVTSSRRPTFKVRNGAVSALAGPVTIYFQVSKNVNFNNVVAVFNVSQSPGSTTSAVSPKVLAAKTTFYWRVRAADGVYNTVFGSPASFKTPAATPAPKSPAPTEPAPTEPTPTGPAPAPFCCPPPNRFEVVQQVASETGYPHSGIHVSNFTQIVAERLAQEDPNWGRRINDTGPLGKDTVAYRINGQNNNPFSIDIVLGATGPNPRIHWSEHGSIGGVWTPAK